MLRFRLAAKLAMASVPIALAALLAGGYVAWTFLQAADVSEETSRGSTVASEAMGALGTLWSEQHLANTLLLRPDQVDQENLEAARVQTDLAFANLRSSIDRFVDGARPDSKATADRLQIDAEQLTDWIAALRAEDTMTSAQAAGYNDAGDLLFDIVSQISLHLEDRAAAQNVGAAEALAEAASLSFQQEQLVRTFIAQGQESGRQLVETALDLREQDVQAWQARAAVASPAAAAEIISIQAMEEAVTGRPVAETVDIDDFPADRNEVLIVAADRLAAQASQVAAAEAEAARDRALAVGIAVGAILLIAGFATVRIERSLVKRVRSVTAAARRVADVELPNLVSALRNPDGATAPDHAASVRMREAGADEVGDLARSFAALHGTLIEVAGQQMDILRKGVSEIFVTLARRNSSLVDRQLALIDKLESKEEDPETLAGYYRLDHLSTRMRRNAESLLVLAGAESPRMWEKPLEIGDVVRAALGEVDEYQRIDILALEPVKVSGHVVADIAHLLSELLDNATQFSPPTERVRVAGLFDESGYLLTISDHGIGISDDRIVELNHLLAHPPVLGLALEPTLGLYVVARLAARHGMTVRLASGVPGITVRIVIPRALLETSHATGTDGSGRLQSTPDPSLVRRVSATSAPKVAVTAPAARWAPEPTGAVASQAAPTGNGEAKAVVTRPAPLQPRQFDPSQALPTRVPGHSFQDDGAVPTSTASEIGPDGIKAALSAFQTGRDTAEKLSDRPSGDEGGKS